MQTITADMKWAMSEDGAPFSGLEFLWLEVTRKCNLQCVHCYAESTPFFPAVGIMTYVDWRNVLEEGFSLGCRAVQFIGGEPTIYPHLLRLVSDANSIGYGFIEVFTNGTALNESLIDAFVRHGVHLAFSVYAHRPETHDGITQRKGSLEKTIRGIRLAISSGLPVRAGVITMGLNLNEVEETKAMLRGVGVESVGSDRVRGIGRGNSLVPSVAPLDELCGACWKGKLAVDADGNAFPCVFSKFWPVGNVRGGLAPIIRSFSLNHFRNALRTRVLHAEEACYPDACDPSTCYPQTRPCGPDCAPSSDRCVPEMRESRAERR